MRTIKARKVCREEVIKLLKSIGLVEGISLSDIEIQKTDKILFWHGVLRNEKGRNKTTYLSYYFPSFENKVTADNDDFIREVMVAIDVFSKKSFDSKQNLDLLEKLEDVFKDNGFEVEFADEIYENETLLFHYPMTLYKIYSKGDRNGATDNTSLTTLRNGQ